MVGSLLASTIGEGESEISDRVALFTAWRTFIEAASRQAPLVVAVEDLHWSSDTLLDLFEFVLQPRGDTRALLIALARPELLDRRPNWGGGRRNHVSIALEPLDDRATAQLVRTLAEGASDDLVDAIVTRAEGNPFFAGEIVSAVLERVRSFDDPAEVEAALARLPDTVQATVLARLDELPDDEREALRVGSVFGRTFRPQGVAALIGRAGVDGDFVASIAERLSERDLVRPTGADGYTFRHILIREVAYSTLARATRAALHGAAGRWLEQRAAGREEALAELVAYHFREAASLATAMELDDAAALRESARIWLTRAAEVARSAAATLEARGHVAAALEFARPEDLPDLYDLYGDVEIGGSAKIAHYREALRLGREAGRSAAFQLSLVARILITEMRAQGSVANRATEEQVASLRQEGRSLASKVTDARPRALFLAADAFYPFWLRTGAGTATSADRQGAEKSAQEALELGRVLDDVNIQSAALDALSALAQERGDWRATIDMGRVRMAMDSRLELRERIDAYAVAAWGAIIDGDLRTADEVSEAGLAVIQPGQAPEWTLHLIAWRVTALYLFGKWDVGLTLADQGYRTWVDTGRMSAGYATRGFVAGLLMARARREEALSERLASTVDEIASYFARNPRYVFLRALARGDIVEVARAMVEPFVIENSAAFEQVEMALSACNDVLQPVDRDSIVTALERAQRFNAHMFVAELRRALGLLDADRDSLVTAMETFARSGAVPFEARTRCELALGDRDRPELDAGLRALEVIGDVVQVERYLKRWSSQ